MYWGGQFDAFDPSPPSESAVLSPSLITALANCAGIHSEFDTTPTDGHCFGHSFADPVPPGCKLTSARLQIRMKAVRGLSTNDTLSVLSEGRLVWGSRIDTLPGVGGHWEQGQTATLLLDFDNLPNSGGSILGDLGAPIEIKVQDDTSVDGMRLIVRFDCCGRVCGRKFLDQNCNGRRDVGENSLSGWTLALADTQGGARTTSTGADGSYCFDRVRPGSYALGELAHTGWTQTAPGFPGQYYLEIASGQLIEDLDFGNQRCGACERAQPVGACCTRDGCLQMSFEECRRAEGLWGGARACGAKTCTIRGGACCTRQGCLLTLPAGCSDLGGAWQGCSTSCAQSSCSEP